MPKTIKNNKKYNVCIKTTKTECKPFKKIYPAANNCHRTLKDYQSCLEAMKTEKDDRTPTKKPSNKYWQLSNKGYNYEADIQTRPK